MVWLVMTEEGVGNVKTYEFAFEQSARDFFDSRWVARILVDPQSTEVSGKHGMNPFALRRIRESMLQKVVVTSLSGKELMLQLPGHATVRDIKSNVEASWGLAWLTQRMSVGSQVATDSDTVTALRAAEGAIPLHITMVQLQIKYPDTVVQRRYDELSQALQSARSAPACVDDETHQHILGLAAEVANIENECHDNGIDLKTTYGCNENDGDDE